MIGLNVSPELIAIIAGILGTGYFVIRGNVWKNKAKKTKQENDVLKVEHEFARKSQKTILEQVDVVAKEEKGLEDAIKNNKTVAGLFKLANDILRKANAKQGKD